jgi:predicted Fe-Mo cluster-binding NifX family protein
MKVALSIWNERIAPVFDASERCLIVDTELPETNGERVEFPGWSADEKARALAERGVTTVVCGAVSLDYEEAFIAHGIEILSFIAGPVEQVIEAWKAGTLIGDSFSMPGCGCPRRRRCRRRGRAGSLNL